MLEAAKKRVRMLVEDLPRFPSLLISAEHIVPQGRFAEAQAEFLQPKPAEVEKLVQVIAAWLTTPKPHHCLSVLSGDIWHVCKA